MTTVKYGTYGFMSLMLGAQLALLNQDRINEAKVKKGPNKVVSKQRVKHQGVGDFSLRILFPRRLALIHLGTPLAKPDHVGLVRLEELSRVWGVLGESMGLKAFRHDREWIEMAQIPADARQTYLTRRQTDVLQCKAALASKDWDVIERTGHKMKGNAETFGFELLTDIGFKLEKAAQEKNIEKTSEALTQFEKTLESLSADSEY